MSTVWPPDVAWFLESCVRAYGTLSALYSAKFPRLWSARAFDGPLFTAFMIFIGPTSSDASTVTRISADATDTASEEKKAGAHIYERTVQNPDGSITHITAETQEEFNEKIKEQAEANREAFSRY